MPATSSKKTALIIINPALEKRAGLNLEQLIQRFLDADQFDYDILYTKSREEITTLSGLIEKKYQVYIVAGGDGTVNSVGRHLINSVSIMGIIPLGSGNGLARSLKIPLKPEYAIETINSLKISVIDTGLVNGMPFLNMAGAGFDAAVAHRYSKSVRRGFMAYLMNVLALLFRYHP